MKSWIFLSLFVVGAALMSGCNTNTPAPISTTPDQASTQAYQDATATITVLDEDIR